MKLLNEALNFLFEKDIDFFVLAVSFSQNPCLVNLLS